MRATKKGHIAIVRMLLEKNAHINLVDMVRRLYEIAVPDDHHYFAYRLHIKLVN